MAAWANPEFHLKKGANKQKENTPSIGQCSPLQKEEIWDRLQIKICANPRPVCFPKIGLRWECDSDMCWLRSLKRWGTTLKHAGIPLGMSAIYIHSTPIPRPLAFLSWALTQFFNQIYISYHCISITVWNYFTFHFLLHISITLWNYFTFTFSTVFLSQFQHYYQSVPKWKQQLKRPPNKRYTIT